MARRLAVALTLAVVPAYAPAQAAACARLVFQAAGAADASFRPQSIIVGQPKSASPEGARIPRAGFDRILAIVARGRDDRYARGDGQGSFAISCGDEPVGSRGFIGPRAMAEIVAHVSAEFTRVREDPPAIYRTLAASLPAPGAR